jgi:ArsR family metal-binding transcriptional regulator
MASYTPSSTPNSVIINLESKLINEINKLNKCLSDTNNTNCNLSDLSDLTDLTNQITNFMTTSNYNNNHDYIMSQWQTIIQLRNDLDVKLQNVNSLNNSEAREKQMQLDTTIYINVLMAILATSILFFMFSRKK